MKKMDLQFSPAVPLDLNLTLGLFVPPPGPGESKEAFVTKRTDNLFPSVYRGNGCNFEVMPGNRQYQCLVLSC